MDEKQFKTSYVAQFLASYMASRYDEDCMNGHVGKPYENQPITDAVFLANCAWEQIKKEVLENRSMDEKLFEVKEELNE